MLIQKRQGSWIMTYLYRGLIFGDGDGLDKMGLKSHEGTEDHPVLGVFMIVGTVIFNVTILNLLVAVYGNEYEKIDQRSHLIFVQERAKYCLTYVETVHMARTVNML